MSVSQQSANQPTNQKTNQPTNRPTHRPTDQLTNQLTNQSTNQPTRQPPNYIGTPTARPGLTFEEARAQFVLWAAMKAPLVLGVGHAEIATLSTDHPEYFQLLTNPELIQLDKDIANPAVVVAQSPSQQQQQPGTVLNVRRQVH